MKRIFLFAAAAVLFAVILLQVVPAIWSHFERKQLIVEQEHVIKPPVERLSSASSIARKSAAATSSAPEKRDAVNWDVPFTSQAPFAVWDALHGEACEEASVLMVMRYFSGQPIASPDDAERAIQHLVAANTALGYTVDDTAAEVIKLLKSQDSSLSAVLLKNPSVDNLKDRLAAGSLIIIPAAGRQLGNPYFQNPGPIYHMLVLRGFTADGYAITNDPGTKRGEQYAYRWDVLLNAIHDWNGGDVEHGEKVVIVVSR